MIFDDWQVILRERPNLLMQGQKAVTDAWLSRLLPHCTGSSVLEGVSTYGFEEQHALLRWIDGNGVVQLITTTEEPLFDLVERGHFMRQLYYRLNTVFLDLSAAPPAPLRIELLELESNPSLR
jgi:hypothetical protein